MSDEEDSASRDHPSKHILVFEEKHLGRRVYIDNTVIKELAEALEHAEYALDRAICFKHPSSSQKEIEKEAQAAAKQALTKYADRIEKAKEADND